MSEPGLAATILREPFTTRVGLLTSPWQRVFAGALVPPSSSQLRTAVVDRHGYLTATWLVYLRSALPGFHEEGRAPVVDSGGYLTPQWQRFLSEAL